MEERELTGLVTLTSALLGALDILLMVGRYMLHTTVLCFAQLGVRPRIAAHAAPADTTA